MTKKKGNKARHTTDIKENINANATSKAPKPGPVKGVSLGQAPLKNNKPTAPPKEQVGLLVTAELEKAMEECKTKVKQIVKGCRASNRKYRDLEFDLENDKMRCLKGLNYDGEDVPPGVLRVSQIFDNPQFTIDGADAIDIVQGRLGDCYFLSAMATITTSKGLIEKLCVERDEEVGVYGFVFFRGATWVSVIIDDQLFWSLPRYEELSSKEQDLYRGDREMYIRLSQHGGKGLHFARSGTEGETWVPLIEKAYAKLHGSYGSLDGGFSSAAVEDLTGGVSVMYLTKDILDTDRFWREELLKATEDRLFGCSFTNFDISRKTEMLIEFPKVKGLIGSHAYSILRAKECRGKRFVMCRNPWGQSEWTGAWADGSKEWSGEWLEVLKELPHEFGDDGEFVMEYSDFLDTFELIERTYLFDSSWLMSSHWLRGPPQPKYKPWGFGDLSFSFVLSQASSTIISLSQLDTRYFADISGTSNWNIDFVVYKRGDTEITAVSYNAMVMSRSVSCEVQLEAGEYIVFPRYERYTIREKGYFAEQCKDWDDRKLARVLTERAKSRSIAANLPEGIESEYFPKTIEELIEQDLQKLQPEEENQEVVEDDGNGQWQEEGSDVEEEGSVGIGPPGSEYEYASDEYPHDFEDEDTDAIILGVRIYTKGVAVSVTGNVAGEMITREDEDGDEKEDEKGDEKEDENEEGKDKNSKKKPTKQTGDKEGSKVL